MRPAARRSPVRAPEPGERGHVDPHRAAGSRSRRHAPQAVGTASHSCDPGLALRAAELLALRRRRGRLRRRARSAPPRLQAEPGTQLALPTLMSPDRGTRAPSPSSVRPTARSQRPQAQRVGVAARTAVAAPGFSVSTTSPAGRRAARSASATRRSRAGGCGPVPGLDLDGTPRRAIGAEARAWPAPRRGKTSADLERGEAAASAAPRPQAGRLRARGAGGRRRPLHFRCGGSASGRWRALPVPLASTRALASQSGGGAPSAPRAGR